jgi:hypothetical protein
MTAIITWLIGFLGGPVVTAVLRAILKLLVNEGRDLFPVALSKIAEVAPKDISTLAKFQEVYAAVRAAASENLTESDLNLVIEAAYSAWKKDGVA